MGQGDFGDQENCLCCLLQRSWRCWQWYAVTCLSKLERVVFLQTQLPAEV